MDAYQFITQLLQNNPNYESMKIIQKFNRPYNLRGIPRNYDYNGTMLQHLKTALNSQVVTTDWNCFRYSKCVYERALYNKKQKNPDFKRNFKSVYIEIIFKYIIDNNLFNNEYRYDYMLQNTIFRKLNEFKSTNSERYDVWKYYELLLTQVISYI
tara:strand:+ start:113 stop:577 length:465 start_codon:yes stop_codon:yes gene_type:complete